MFTSSIKLGTIGSRMATVPLIVDNFLGLRTIDGITSLKNLSVGDMSVYVRR